MGNREAEERAKQRGEAERREREREERARLAEEEERNRELNERLRLSCTRAWLLVDTDSFTGTMVLTLIVMAVLVGVGMVVELMGRKPPANFVQWGPTVIAASAATVVGLLLMRAAINRQASAAWAKEQAWLFALPFKHEGYVKAVATARAKDKLELRITFEGPAVHQMEQARLLLAKVDPGGEISHQNDEIRISANLTGEEDQERVDSVRDARVLFRDLVEVVLIPLNHQSRVVRVEIHS